MPPSPNCGSRKPWWLPIRKWATNLLPVESSAREKLTMKNRKKGWRVWMRCSTRVQTSDLPMAGMPRSPGDLKSVAWRQLSMFFCLELPSSWSKMIFRLIGQPISAKKGTALRVSRRVLTMVGLWCFTQTAPATTITNTRSEVAFMAGLWEADSIQISPLADAQYPQFGTNVWQYPFVHNNLASDGDFHVDMAIDSSGTGTNGNNTQNSPIIAEVVNARSSNPPV